MSREDASLKVPETWEEGADKSGSAFLDIQRLSHLLHKKRCGGKKDLWPQSRLRAPFFDSHGWFLSTFPGAHEGEKAPPAGTSLVSVAMACLQP